MSLCVVLFESTVYKIMSATIVAKIDSNNNNKTVISNIYVKKTN